jgi:hypothetical protein
MTYSEATKTRENNNNEAQEGTIVASKERYYLNNYDASNCGVAGLHSSTYPFSRQKPKTSRYRSRYAGSVSGMCSRPKQRPQADRLTSTESLTNFHLNFMRRVYEKRS